MKSLTNLLYAAIGAFLLTACSTSKPLTMNMALEKGTTFDYEITSTNNIGMSVMGQDMSVDGKASQDYNFTVKNIQPIGITDIDFKIDRITVDLTVPMTDPISYDSDKGNTDSPLGSLGGIIGKSMEANLNKNGTVTSIEGADAMLKQVLGKVKGGAQIATLLEGYIGEEAFKNSFATITGFSQGKPLAIGDSWSKQMDTESGVSLNTDYTYTIRERSGGKVTIDVTGESKSDPNAKPIEAQGVKMSYNLAGPVTGVIVVDEKTGWAITSDIQQDLSGKITVGGTPLGDMNLDAKMKIGLSAKRK
ncbi:MAG: DUF6263 family protein [Saprospiraceae bacterium]